LIIGLKGGKTRLDKLETYGIKLQRGTSRISQLFEVVLGREAILSEEINDLYQNFTTNTLSEFTIFGLEFGIDETSKFDLLSSVTFNRKLFLYLELTT